MILFEKLDPIALLKPYERERERCDPYPKQFVLGGLKR